MVEIDICMRNVGPRNFSNVNEWRKSELEREIE